MRFGFQLLELLHDGFQHVIVERFRSGLFGGQESLSVKFGQCLPSHSFSTGAKFVLESCVSFNLAHVK